MRGGALPGASVVGAQEETQPWPVAHGLLLLGVVALGVALRLSCAVRPLWIDEAWVLNSVHSPTLGGMFAYPEWLQTTPPGLLLLLRALAQAWPQAIETLRWPFLLCSVVTLLLFVRLASHFLGRGFLCLACATFALSPNLIWNATELKQYSGDALAMISSLLLGAAYVRHPSRAALARWCVLNLAWVPLSFSAVFSLPAMVVAGALLGDGPTWHARLRAVLPHAVSAALAIGLLYAIVVRPNVGSAGMASFWAEGFHATAGESMLFYLRRSWSVMFGFLDFKLASVPVAAALVGGCAIGMLALWRAPGWSVQQRLAWMTLLAAPVAGTWLANGLGSYPLSEYRMVAFLAPCLILLLTLGLEQLARMICAFGAVPTRQHCVQGLGLATALVMVVNLASMMNFPLWGTARNGGVRLWRSGTEIQPVLAYLRAVDTLRRPVFVHAYYQQLFKLYTRAEPLRAPVTFAQSGWPCCVPGRPWRGYAPDPDEVDQEVARLIERNGAQPFYVLLYARPTWPSRDSVLAYETRFAARHCALPWRMDTTRVALVKVECAVTR